MEIPKNIKYKEETYRLQKSGRYYCSDKKDAKERLLHRRIYSDQYGEIQKGFHVHHIDGDCFNNSIQNLQTIEASVHSSYHMFKKFEDKEFREKNKFNLQKAVEKSKEWHASEEGLKWHSVHGKKTWESREKKVNKCAVCFKEYKTFYPTSSKFCSVSCEQKNYYKQNKVIMQCEYCKKKYQAYKYRKQRFCSRKCSAIVTGSKKKGI